MLLGQLSFSFVTCLCISLSETYLIDNNLPDDMAADKRLFADHLPKEIKKESEDVQENSRDGKLLQFLYLNPSYPVYSKSNKDSGILEGLRLRGFGNNGLNNILQGLEGVAGFVGGKLGVILGGPVGIPIGALLGGLKGAYAGAEMGSQIAKSPFKLFKGLGSLGGQTYGSYTSYTGIDGTKYIIAHP